MDFFQKQLERVILFLISIQLIFITPFKPDNLEKEDFSKFINKSFSCNKTETPPITHPIFVRIIVVNGSKAITKNQPKSLRRRLFVRNPSLSPRLNPRAVSSPAIRSQATSSSKRISPEPAPRLIYVGSTNLKVGENTAEGIILPQVDKSNFPSDFVKRITGDSISLKEWVKHAYSGPDISESQRHDQDLKSKIVIPFRQFVKKYIMNVKNDEALGTHYATLRTLYMRMKGLTEAQMQEKYISVAQFKTTTNRKGEIKSDATQNDIEINTRFTTETFHMFCTLLADKETTSLQSGLDKGQFRLNNTKAEV
jgi:hypothetical protein